MPMGITSDIYDDKDVSLKNYMITVARSLTDFIHLRDHGSDSSLTLRVATQHHSRALADAQNRLDHLTSTSHEQLLHEKQQQDKDNLLRWEETKRFREDLKARYESMLDRVRALDVPDEISYAKSYAEKYLLESIDFDCSDYDRYKPTVVDFDVWLENQISRAYDDIAYHAKHHAEELDRVKQFNEKIALWIELIESIDE